MKRATEGRTNATRAGRRLLAVLAGLCWPACLLAGTLEVGPGRPYSRIEDAHQAARPGDVILVHPLPDGAPHERVGVYVSKPRLTFRGAVGAEGRRVKLSGKGFEHSGRGSVPRAMFQFNKGTDDCTLEGFEIFGAHNREHNGAGVRVNQANNVTVRNCEIHHNDMGMMSNGDGSPTSAVNQVVESCIFHHNGDPADPGYNHNLYLGGTGVTLRFCEVHSALTGHNVKSRAHFTRVEYCYIHDSANRELDLVDAADTDRPGSHAVLVGNIIVKDPRCKGNKAVIHFGQDGGKEHDGTLHLVHNTIVTPFLAPVVDLSAPKARALLRGNIVHDGGRAVRGQTLAEARKGATLKNVGGSDNWLAPGFADKLGGTGLDVRANCAAKSSENFFVDPLKGNFRLARSFDVLVNKGPSAEKLSLPPTPGADKTAAETALRRQYKHPAGGEDRPDDGKSDLGAYEYSHP